MIEVNGKKVQWIKNENINELLERMSYIFPLVIVKINDEVIPKNNYSKKLIPDNSKVAVIHMISGG
jgi:sulfur carrier protein